MHALDFIAHHLAECAHVSNGLGNDHYACLINGSQILKKCCEAVLFGLRGDLEFL